MPKPKPKIDHTLVAAAKAQMAQLPPPELRTVEHDKRYQPWKVTFSVLQSKVDPGHAVELFVRAPTYEVATKAALKYWTKWFRIDRGVPQDEAYPAVAAFDNEAGALVEVIDEDTYMEGYKMIQTLRAFRVAGDPDNPHGFAAYGDDDLRSGDSVHVTDTTDG